MKNRNELLNRKKRLEKAEKRLDFGKTISDYNKTAREREDLLIQINSINIRLQKGWYYK